MKIDLIGIIDEFDYINYSKKYREERNLFLKKVEGIEEKIKENSQNKIDYKEIMNKNEKFLEEKYINNEIVFEIIEKIEIDRNKKIFIYFNFRKEDFYRDKEFEIGNE